MKKKPEKKGVSQWLLGVTLATVLAGGLGLYKYMTEPVRGIALDGDSVSVDGGKNIRLLGVNTEERGESNYLEAKIFLNNLIAGKELWLESDRTDKDRYGRSLYWVWVDCEGKPSFWQDNYMVLTPRAHRPGLKENPEGCIKGKLVNEEIIKAGYSKAYFLSKKGEMKYESRILEAGK